jgi:peptidyl-tRNA hydrolase
MSVQKVKTPVLYVLMRTDMKSMNPGKAMAQATHAANCAAKRAENEIPSLYDHWERETGQHFGTCYVLSVPSENEMNELIAEIEAENMIRKEPMVAGIILDPTYPIVDGAFVHYLPVYTCAYVMGYKEDFAASVIKGLRLHP